jgi:hypothetical protein
MHEVHAPSLSTKDKKQEKTDSDSCYLSTDPKQKRVTAKKLCQLSHKIAHVIEFYLDGQVRS